MARVVVTGGVGFIGYHLTRALLARGDNVVVVDDFSDAPYPSERKWRNERDLREQFPSLRVLRAEITNREAIAPAFEGVDVVFHLAALAGVRPSFAAPARYARVNVEGTTTVFELTRDAGCRKFVFASSSSVYGNATPLPAQEEAAAIVPESPYAATKRSAELVVSSLCRRSPEMHCPALRFFTVYGPRQRPEMAITMFTKAVLENQPITVFGDGSMRRDFTHVDDIVRGLLAAAEKAPFGVRPYNLGSNSPVDLRTLVRTIGEVCGLEPTIEHASKPIGDVDATFADISRARTELGWEPRIRLREGLTTVVQWLRSTG